MSDLFKDFEKMGHQKKSKIEVEKAIFGGQTRREVMGAVKDDPASQPQIAKIFAVGGELGLKKDEIKEQYGFESFRELTVIEAIDIINRMEADTGGTYKKVSKPTSVPTVSAFDPTAFKEAAWTKKAGINMINGKVARCGLCLNFEEGSCKKGIIKGRIDSSNMAPIVHNCFEFLYSPLVKEVVKKEEETDDDCPF